jgi:hypothetical protein
VCLTSERLEPRPCGIRRTAPALSEVRSPRPRLPLTPDPRVCTRRPSRPHQHEFMTRTSETKSPQGSRMISVVIYVRCSLRGAVQRERPGSMPCEPRMRWPSARFPPPPVPFTAQEARAFEVVRAQNAHPPLKQRRGPEQARSPHAKKQQKKL